MMSDSPQIDVQDIDHLGIIAGIIDEIGIVEIIDQLLGTHDQERVTPGQVVKALILNCMGFLSAPLYLFSQFFEGKATEHLIAPGVLPEHLNDTRLGRVLDKLYCYGVTKLFVSIALEVVQKFAIELKTVHLDSTSLSVEGQYLEKENSMLEDAVPIKITHGYSRDHRADLKQFMINLLVSEDGGIPLCLELGNGNDADKAVFVPVIQEFQKQWTITESSVEVIVAVHWQSWRFPHDCQVNQEGDSAMYTSKNIQALGTTNWITLVPTTIATAKKLLESIASEQLSSIRGRD